MMRALQLIGMILWIMVAWIVSCATIAAGIVALVTCALFLPPVIALLWLLGAAYILHHHSRKGE